VIQKLNAISTGENRNAYKNLMGKPERRRPLGVPTLRRESKTKNGFESPGRSVERVDWIDMAQDMIGSFIKFRKFLGYL
jgi:hypothetical protein